jgi:hypothetical protein
MSALKAAEQETLGQWKETMVTPSSRGNESFLLGMGTFLLQKGQHSSLSAASSKTAKSLLHQGQEMQNMTNPSAFSNTGKEASQVVNQAEINRELLIFGQHCHG